MRMSNRHSEKGIALILSILALLLLSAIAVGMMYTSSTEASVNANFKSEEIEYFAARAGVEEVRDRMFPGNPNTINGIGTIAGVCQVGKLCLLPTVLPGAIPGPGEPAPVLYILQNGVTMTNGANGVLDISSSNANLDDEFCHDFPYAGSGYGGMNTAALNVRCNSLPAGTAWYTTPQPATAAPYSMDWKWVWNCECESCVSDHRPGSKSQWRSAAFGSARGCGRSRHASTCGNVCHGHDLRRAFVRRWSANRQLQFNPRDGTGSVRRRCGSQWKRQHFRRRYLSQRGCGHE